MQRPRCREIRERNRAGHTFLLQAWETCARAPSPNRSSKRKLGPQEAKGSPSIHPNPSFPRRRESISLCGRGRSRTVRGIWIPACAGMTKGRSHPAHRHAVPFGGLRTGLFQHPPRGRRQAAEWIPACADAGAKTVPPFPPPPSQAAKPCPHPAQAGLSLPFWPSSAKAPAR